MNYGLDLERERREQSEKDWVFGASSQACLAEIPIEERFLCMPAGEVQRTTRGDMSDCASRAPVNLLEAKFNWMLQKGIITVENRLWLIDNGYLTENGIEFSDAFVAILSNTTPAGNSLKAPCEMIRSKKDATEPQGLIPKVMLPLEPWMSFDDYHHKARITPKMVALGKEFARRFTINYERVYREDFPTLLETDMIDGAGYAWPFPDDSGVYRRTGRTFNHAWLFVTYGEQLYRIFDNYIDTHDDDFVKTLAADYDILEYGYRVFVSDQLTEEETPEPDTKKSTFLARFFEFLARIFSAGFIPKHT